MYGFLLRSGCDAIGFYNGLLRLYKGCACTLQIWIAIVQAAFAVLIGLANICTTAFTPALYDLHGRL
jgi:hypothetical protein